MLAVLLGLMILDGPRPSIGAAEHLRLRLDYRLFLLDDPEGASGVPSTKRPQRLSAGLHLVF